MQPGWWTLFVTFFRIGAFTIGGGFAMVPLIQAEVVDRRGWLALRDFVDLVGIAQAAPGPIAINVAVLVGYRVARVPGALVAALGATIPSFIAILAVVSVFRNVEQNRLVQEVFRGIRPAVVGLVAVAAWRIGRVSITSAVDLVWTGAALGLLLLLHWHPIAVILAGGVAGLIVTRNNNQADSH